MSIVEKKKYFLLQMYHAKIYKDMVYKCHGC